MTGRRPPPDSTDPAYAAAVGALAARGRFGIRLGLGRTRAILAHLGDPHLGLPGALVGGTNGKGSVVALADSVLRAGGWRTGTTTSPHLVSYRERVTIDGQPVDPDTFARLIEYALAAATVVERRHGEATEFELLTAAAFLGFALGGVEAALVEVGLGGRLDATNVWDGGVATITNVDLDHTEQLGPTIEAIAREKAAIIKRGDRAATGADGDALRIIRRRASQLNVALLVSHPRPILGLDRDGIDVDLPPFGRTRVGLRGRHQAANVEIAFGTLISLAFNGIGRIDQVAVQDGFARVRWPGRLELVEVPGRGGRPVEVLLDGAHNPAGAATLAAALDDLRPFLAGGTGGAVEIPPLTLVTASMADKDVDGIAAALLAARAMVGARVIATTVAGERGLPAAELARHWSRFAEAAGLTIEAVDDPDAALDRALAVAPGPVVVAGSLYLVGAIRSRLVGDIEADPIPPPA